MPTATPSPSPARAPATAAARDQTRLQHWGIVTVCSIISLASVCAVSNARAKDSVDRFAISVSSISLIIGFVFLVNAKWTDHTGKPNILNRGIIEFAAAGFNFIIWCVGIALINRKNTESYGPGIKYANIYYFTWGTFLSVFLVLFEVGKHTFRPNEAKHPRLRRWVLMITANAVAFISSSFSFRQSGCTLHTDDRAAYCTGAIFGVALGTISCILACLASFVTLIRPKGSKTILTIETVLSLALTIAWAFGVSNITGAHGPGATIGNIYYSTWISFFSALTVFLNCVTYMKVEARNAFKKTGKNANAKDGKNAKAKDGKNVNAKDAKNAKPVDKAQAVNNKV